MGSAVVSRGLMTLVLLVFVALESQLVASEEPMVTIWRVVPTDFYNPNFDKQVFQKLLQSSPLREISVEKEDTLSHVIQRTFNISETWTPAVYAEMLAFVQNLNNLKDPKELKPGKIYNGGWDVDSYGA